MLDTAIIAQLVNLNVSKVALKSALNLGTMSVLDAAKASIEFITDLADSIAKVLPSSMGDDTAAQVIELLMVSVEAELLDYSDTEPPYTMSLVEKAVWMNAEDIEDIAGADARTFIEQACEE